MSDSPWASGEIVTGWSDYAVCPYCGHEHEVNRFDRDWELRADVCQSCGKSFGIAQKISFSTVGLEAEA